jgi:molybdopterin molybdotransferase
VLVVLCSGAMFDTHDLGVLPDDPTAMTAALRAMAGQYDLIISTGAASDGARDYLRAALVAAGGRVDAHRIALKPGKPVFFGGLGTALYTGLPGNPLAAFVGFELFVKAQIEALAGLLQGPARQARAVLRGRVRRKPGRTEFVPVLIAAEAGDRPVVEPLGHGSSATLYPLSHADGVVVVPAECASLEDGDLVSWLPFPRSTRAFGV